MTVEYLAPHYSRIANEVWLADPASAMKWFNAAVRCYESESRLQPYNQKGELLLNIAQVVFDKSKLLSELNIKTTYRLTFNAAVRTARSVAQNESDSDLIGRAYLLMARAFKYDEQLDMSLRYVR